MEILVNGLIVLSVGLYFLGTYQGNLIADVVEEAAGKDMELTPGARFMLKWLWPYATVRAMWESAYGE